MKGSTLFSGVILVAAFAISTVYAEKATTPKAQLEREATHIVVGKVRSISTKRTGTQFEVTHYIAEIVVDKIEKGQGIKVGDVVPARYLSIAWRGTGSPPAADSGHWPTPKEGDAVRVYLVNKGYNGAGWTTDDGYDVYLKNGFEILAPPIR